jgi:hypothetical protein
MRWKITNNGLLAGREDCSNGRQSWIAARIFLLVPDQRLSTAFSDVSCLPENDPRSAGGSLRALIGGRRATPTAHGRTSKHVDHLPLAGTTDF